MNRAVIKQELRGLIEVINEQQLLLLSYEGKIPELELDILKSNIQKLYENWMELNKTAQSAKPEATPAITPVENVGSDELIAKMFVVEEHNELQAEIKNVLVNNVHPLAAEQKDSAITKQEPPAEDSSETISAHTTVMSGTDHIKERAREFSKPVSKMATTASLFDDAPTVADKFKSSPTIYDKIASAKDDQSLAGKLQKNPVSDLKKSIGINDKFSFINELFDGDPERYNSAIEQLNSCGNYKTALDLLTGELAVNNNWSDEGENFKQLKVLLERRFGV